MTELRLKMGQFSLDQSEACKKDQYGAKNLTAGISLGSGPMEYSQKGPILQATTPWAGLCYRGFWGVTMAAWTHSAGYQSVSS
jgi:hypothetical protein